MSNKRPIQSLFTLLSMRSHTILLLKYSIGVHLMPSCTYSSCKTWKKSSVLENKASVEKNKNRVRGGEEEKSVEEHYLLCL